MKNKELKFLACVITLVILYFMFVANVIDKGLEEVEVIEDYETVTIINNNAGVASAVMGAAEPEEVTTPKLLGNFELTAYCSCRKCCKQWADNRPKDELGNELVYGASGELLVAGYSIAVDPTVIPYGTVVIIDGKEYKAHDCGGSIKGNSIDVYFNSHEDALEFGVQYADVYFFE